MNKKLKIQFWKAERALAMQILEQEGLPRNKEEGLVKITDSPWLYGVRIRLRGCKHEYDWNIEREAFNTNAERDECLQKVVNAITNELFTGEGELKIGEMCEVKDDRDERWTKRKLLAILPEKYDKRFIVETWNYSNEHSSWDCARPIAKRTEPTVEECGQLVTYT